MTNLVTKDFKYIWHPYTQMKEARAFPPLVIDRARGIKLYDNKGRAYYDTISSWWCNVHGHNHPVIKKAITRQLNELEHVLFAGCTHEPAITVAEELARITPSKLTKVFFSDNGSTAVEVALKMSFQYWRNHGRNKKKYFLSLEHGYHGDTIGAMAVSGVGLFNEVFNPLFFKTLRSPAPYCYRCPFGKEPASCAMECVSALEKIIREKHASIAGIILEPLIMAAGGMIIYPKKYLKRAAQAAKKYDIHLIVDEVATGFGRTGKMFALEHAKIQPDFMCLSKGVTSGYLPLGVTLTTKKIFDAFYDDYEKKKTFYHGHTYTANPLACAAAMGSFEVFTRERTLEHITKIIPLFHEELECFRDLPHVGDIRKLGMIGALELVRDKKKKTPFGLRDRIGVKIYREALAEGLLLRPLGDIVYFYLPLCITERQVKDIVRKTYKVLEKMFFNSC